jgi:hypothetical protein
MKKKDLDPQPTGTLRRAAFAVALTCIASALPGIAPAAPCPPGYHGSAPHCMPDQAKTHHPYATTTGHHSSGATPLGSSTPAPAHAKIADWHKPGPSIGPGPVEHHADTASTKKIIFVGGKSSLNPQPIPPGHSATPPHGAVPTRKELPAAPSPGGSPS